MTYTPIHPAFTGTFPVSAHGGITHTVNLDANICTCSSGAAFAFKDNKQIVNAYCIHKLKAMAEITQDDPDRLVYHYAKALATRYNVFEVVSAFHKTVRRADVDTAMYWGLVLSKFRGAAGVINYLLNIVYEETRDHELHNMLLDLYMVAKRKEAGTLSAMCTAIRAFCLSKKKWELPHRFNIFCDEMLGYKQLASTYSWNVARAKDIIPEDEYRTLAAHLKAGIAKQDQVRFQRGLKGLMKSIYTEGYQQQKERVLRLLQEYADLAPAEHARNFNVILAIVEKRMDTIKDSLGYHELNALGDALLGESYAAGISESATRNRYADGFSPYITLTAVKHIPLYAQDNHTYVGKAKMRRYSSQLQPGAKQTDLDFRWCGAYFGVAWRTQAFAQHGTCHTAWESVVWDNDLYAIVNAMWY